MDKKKQEHFFQYEKCFLKVDLDLKRKSEVMKTLKERIKFLSEMGFLNLNNILAVKLIKKKNYSVKFQFKKPFKAVRTQVMLQLMLGSDYRKEAFTLFNFMHGINNYNRLFDIKNYWGEFKVAKETDITDFVLSFKKRKT